MLIRSYFMNTKVRKEALVQDEDHNNDGEMNPQNGNKYIMDSAQFKCKYKTRPSKATEETKKGGKKVQNDLKQHINFKYSLLDKNIGLIFILTVFKTNLLQGSLIFKCLYLKHIPGKTNKNWLHFSVTIGYAKHKSQVQFKSDSPIMSYRQHYQECICLSSLDSDFKIPNKLVGSNSISTRISMFLTVSIHDIIKFSNSIMEYQARKFG